jgi:hypothetical protein
MKPATDDPALEALRYPIGRFEPQPSYAARDVAELLQRFEMAPRRLDVAVRGLSATQLDTPYRPSGWTARQVVHHLADSALNGNARFRWALTEEEPTIKPYDENGWSALADARTAPIEPSVAMFEAATKRLVVLFKTFGAKEWGRRYYHPRVEAALAAR